MKDEMAFLKYRREVVQAWPDSIRKRVFLNAIETRIVNVQRQTPVSAPAWRMAAD